MRKADNLPPSCAVDTKSGNLNFLEPSGPVQACNGTALPFYCSLLGTCVRSMRDSAGKGDSRIRDRTEKCCCLCSSEG